MFPWLLILLGIAWFPFLAPVRGWDVAALMFVIGAGFLAWKVSRWTLLVIVVSPYLLVPAFNAVRATTDYNNSTAEVRVYGLWKGFYDPIDPDTRCHYKKMGCVMDGSEMFTSKPYNSMLRYLIRTRGWMPRAYDGPYPGVGETARLLLESSTPVLANDVLKGNFTVDGREVKLDRWGAENAHAELNSRHFRGKGRVSECRGVVLEDRCLILGAIHETSEEDGFPAVLIDLTDGSLINVYRNSRGR